MSDKPTTDAGTIDALTVGLAPSVSLGMAEQSMADSIGIVMQNAAFAQKQGQTISTQVTAIACSLVLAKGSS